MRIRGKTKIPMLLAQAEPWLHSADDGLISFDRTLYSSACLEVGCGKGTFLAQMAEMYPERFFIGLDKFIEIVARAASRAAEKQLPNTRFLVTDVERVQTAIGNRSIDTIYLNFSDPWPRRRNEIRRLTHPRFLAIYEQLLRPRGWLEMKTDNAELFSWSVRSLSKAGWSIQELDHALIGDPPEARRTEARFVRTEYETRFRGLGVPICFLRATPPAVPDDRS